jgi:uncharacterized RDD family membrane protein YckC
VTCPACGYKDIEEGEHRCHRCGRRLDRPVAAPAAGLASAPPPPPPPVARVTSSGGSVAALAPEPEWKQEVAERLEQFRHRRARQQGLFTPPEEEDSETVPEPDLHQKVISFEDIGADRIEPLIVDLPKRAIERPSAALPPREPQAKPEAPRAPERMSRTARLPAPAPAPEARPDTRAPAFQTAPRLVAPVAIRIIAGTLDAAVASVAVGLFLGTFHLLGGHLLLQPRALAGVGLAAAGVTAFYLFLYTCYVAETPGLRWTGLRVLDYDGEPPRAEQRLMRALGSLLSGAALGLGYLWALVDEEALTWHDRMSRTYIARDTRAPQHFRPL